MDANILTQFHTCTLTGWMLLLTGFSSVCQSQVSVTRASVSRGYGSSDVTHFSVVFICEIAAGLSLGLWNFV